MSKSLAAIDNQDVDDEVGAVLVAESILESALEPTIRLADLPPMLAPATAEALFRELESGTPRTDAPSQVGLAYRTVRRWGQAYPAFQARLDEAVEIGLERIVDRYPKIAKQAVCRETAAGAKTQIEALEKYLARVRPKLYAPKAPLFEASAADGQGYGIVIVPMKETGRGLPPSPSAAIESSAVRIPDKHRAEDVPPAE